MGRRTKAATQEYLLLAQLLRRLRGELKRLVRIRGAGRRTGRRIASVGSRLLVAAALFEGLEGPRAEAQCQSHFVNTVGIPDIGYRSHPTFGDIDGDGDLDLFVGDEFDYLMWFFENTGSAAHPKFAPAQLDPFAQGLVGAVFSPALVDIDGDGDLDVFVGNSVGETYFIENVGTASAPVFAPVALNPFGIATFGNDSVPRFVDIDGDKDLDLFMGGQDAMYLLQNTGTPKRPVFAPPVESPFGLSSVHGPAVPAFVDIDRDGDSDLFVGNRPGDIIFFENIGSPKLPMFANAVMNPSGFVPLSTLGEYPTWFSAPTFADIDGDGDFDAFVGEYRGQTFFFENVGTGTAPAFQPPRVAPFGLSSTAELAATALVDLDGDGDLDAFISDDEAHRHFRNDGSSTVPAFVEQGSDPFGLIHPGEFGKLSFADIDADGDSDAFFGASFFLNSGSPATPSFNSPVSNPFGLATDAETPNFVDIDGDGDLDAFSGSGPITFSRNVGSAISPSFAPPVSNPFSLTDPQDPSYGSPEFLDVDGDGDLDATVVVNSYVSEDYRFIAVLFENMGTAALPNFAPPVPIIFGFADEAHAPALTFADIDGDGDPDAVAGRLSEAQSGRSTFATSIVFLRNESLCGVRCPSEPLSACTEGGSSKIRIRRGADNELLWQWGRATAAKAEFGNPAVGTPLALCFFEDQQLAASVTIPPGGICAGAACWDDVRKGFRFKNASGAGVTNVKLREGAGKAKILLRGEGTQLALPMLPLAPTAALTVQLVNPRSADACWQSTFAPPASRNDANSFKSRTP